MDRDELYELLDIESGKDFQYFENIAALLESSEEISGQAIEELLEDVDMEVFGELTESYFGHIEDWIPEAETDFYTLMSNIQRVIMSYINSIVDSDEDQEEFDQMYLRLADEVEKFRMWYSCEDNVEYISDDTGESTMMPVRDALAHAKEEKLGGKSCHFDFSGALGYQLSEYVMSLNDLAELD